MMQAETAALCDTMSDSIHSMEWGTSLWLVGLGVGLGDRIKAFYAAPIALHRVCSQTPQLYPQGFCFGSATFLKLLFLIRQCKASLQCEPLCLFIPPRGSQSMGSCWCLFFFFLIYTHKSLLSSNSQFTSEFHMCSQNKDHFFFSFFKWYL